jgi:hypothetical protein
VHREWQPAEVGRGIRVGRQRAGHADGQSASLAEARVRLAVAYEHGASRGTGRRFPPVNRGEVSVGQPDYEKTSATNAGVKTIHNAQGQSGRNGGINGIAALAHGLERRVRRQWVNGDGDRVFAGGGRGAEGAYGKQQQNQSEKGGQGRLSAKFNTQGVVAAWRIHEEAS